MTEGEKKKIYYDLRTNKVDVLKEVNYITYTFGRYRVNNHGDYINISKSSQKRPGIFVIMDDADWDGDFPKNDVYKISVAVQNKAKGKTYKDPYKDIPIDVEIKNLTKSFGKEMIKNAGEFLPADISKYKMLRTIAEMKQLFAQKMKEYYEK